MTTMQWTDERVSELKRLHNEGHSAAEIAAAMKTTRSTVLGKSWRLKLRENRPVRTKPARMLKRKLTPRVKPSRIGFNTTWGSPTSAAATPPRPETAPVVPSKAQMIAFLSLSPEHCRYPIGHPGDDDFAFCGCPKSRHGGSYCDTHARVTHNEWPPRKRTPAPVPMFCEPYDGPVSMSAVEPALDQLVR